MNCNCKDDCFLVKELEAENQKWKDGIALKDEEIGCIETDFNTFKSKAKEIINDCVCELQNILFYKMRNKERIASTLDKAEQFLSEVEK